MIHPCLLTVRDVNEAAFNLNRDLTKIDLWAWQWKMKLNADKTEEVVSSCKREKLIHPILKLGGEIISTKSEHEHFGVILDSKLNFKSHTSSYFNSIKRHWLAEISFKICIKRGFRPNL